MQPLIRQTLDAVVATIAHSTRADGDLSPSAVRADELEARRAAAVAHPWRSVHQVHSDRVFAVETAADPATPTTPRPFADALTTDQLGVVLAVHSGDCVPVGFIASSGQIGVAHAGWKGLEAGVLESTVRRLRGAAPSISPPSISPPSISPPSIIAAVGPHIRAAKYEFGAVDLDRLSARFGPQVVAETAQGNPALDLTAAIASELVRLEVEIAASSPDCTAADEDQYWSHRARQESGRLALVAWLEPVA